MTLIFLFGEKSVGEEPLVFGSAIELPYMLGLSQVIDDVPQRLLRLLLCFVL